MRYTLSLAWYQTQRVTWRGNRTTLTSCIYSSRPLSTQLNMWLNYGKIIPRFRSEDYSGYWNVLSSFSLKWYKDGQEFYSYIPRMKGTPKRFYHVDGLQINVSHRHVLHESSRHMTRVLWCLHVERGHTGTVGSACDIVEQLERTILHIIRYSSCRIGSAFQRKV